MEYTTCPNCGRKIKEGIVFSNLLLSPALINYVNEFTNEPKEAYCNDCGVEVMPYADLKYKKEIKRLQQTINNGLYLLPVVTIAQPFGWEYKSLGIVTGQNASGIVADLTPSLFSSDEDYRKNMSSSEQECVSLLKRKTLALGGNAIVGIQFNYGEFSSINSKSAMVTAFGTAVIITNPDIVGGEQMNSIVQLLVEQKRLSYLLSIKPQHITSFEY